jgi:polysaccharide deacetylase family protein (PEP-CTERM system associated)
MPHHILLTIDVEDWFQVENFKAWIPFSSWDSRELRVERNVHRLLDLFDELSSKETGDRRQEFQAPSSEALLQPPADHSSSPQTKCSSSEAILEPPPPIRATFFILGWIAERLPHLVREIHARGHEVASHGYCHNLCCDQSCEDLAGDLRDSKKLLEDTIGSEIFGYRAPSFSISDDILKIIAECGYLYDSSYNSFALHGRYGKLNLASSEALLKRSAPQAKRSSSEALLKAQGADPNPYDNRAGIAHSIADGLIELPVSNLPLFSFPTLGTLAHFRHFPLPWGGGGYFRLIPFWLFRRGVQTILEKDNAYVFYMHPWEIDPDQPRVAEVSRSFRFRHYVNLGKTEQKLRSLVDAFSECQFLACRDYLFG